MYRIRTAAGAESNYASLEEFTVAVRRGAVHPEDEIFHTRANRWLDVKSHPHYRSALDGHVPAPAPAAAPSPSSAPTAPHTQYRPALSATPPAPQAPAPRAVQAPSPAPAATQARAQVFERPAAAAPKPVAQTQVHPQLQPQAVKPEAPAPAPFQPPQKSKDLTFVDTGVAPTVGHPVSPAVDVAAPPVRKTELKPAAKPAPIAQSTGSEMDFLVMDGGIESPVRTSAGHKAIPEEFGLLFDDEKSIEPHAPVKPLTEKHAAAKGSKSGKQQAIVIEPEAPAPAAPAASVAPIAPSESAPQAPAAAPAPETPHGSSWATGSRTNYLGGGIALLVIVGGLLAWKPWQGGASDAGPSPVAAQTAAPISGDPNPSSLITPASATTPPMGSLTGAGAAIPAGKTAPVTKPVEAAVAPVDSAKPEVVVAARPEFGGAAVSGDISIGGTDVSTRGSSSAVAPSELVRRLAAAQKDAQLDLNGRLMTLGFRGVINPSRLGTPALVAAARTAWTGGVDAIRTYRARIARTEKAYEDSVLTSQRAQKWPGDEMRAWAGRQSLSEPSDASQLSDLMFTQVAEGLEILGSMPGEYTIKGDKISFKDASSATRYASIRGWVEQRMATWSSTPESARPYSVSATLRALGDGFPAVE